MSMPVGAGATSPATLLLSRPNKALLLQISREPINFNTDNEKYETHIATR